MPCSARRRGWCCWPCISPLLPWALVRWSRFFRELYGGLGRGRFLVMMSLLLIMGLVPIKMLARWTFNLTYFVAFPEYALNF